MQIRRCKPEKHNPFYNTISNGGWSTCIEGNPKDYDCNVLANCVGYACGRFNEIIGSMKYPYLNCNAENFITRAKDYGLDISGEPVVAGIMVFKKIGADYGHVFIVEDIIDNNTIYTSESAWGGSAFFNATRYRNSNWSMGDTYEYLGCIINPSINIPNELDKYTDEELAYMVINGDFGNGEERKEKLGNRYDAVQDLVNKILDGETVDILDLVRKTIRGDFGNGEERKNALGQNYDEVQRQVNLNYDHGTTSWDNIKLY